jgi:hypothetical protein
VKTETLQVPGASLYYEARGSGPVLLMIPGGPMDADGFKAIAERLAEQYTVVTYDCRGNSRSPMEGSWDALTVGLFADDADRLLDAVSAGSTRIVVGVGDESTPQQMVYQTAHALAEKLGGQPARFPGGHGGFGSHPDGFATRLREVLASSPTP